MRLAILLLLLFAGQVRADFWDNCQPAADFWDNCRLVEPQKPLWEECSLYVSEDEAKKIDEEWTIQYGWQACVGTCGMICAAHGGGYRWVEISRERKKKEEPPPEKPAAAVAPVLRIGGG
jgi:hypothetical protein